MSFEKYLPPFSHFHFCEGIFVCLFLDSCLTQVKDFLLVFCFCLFLKCILTGQSKGFLYRETFWYHWTHERYEGIYLFTGNLPSHFFPPLPLMSAFPYTIPLMWQVSSAASEVSSVWRKVWEKKEHKGSFCSSVMLAVSRLHWDLPTYPLLRGEKLLSRNQRHIAISVRGKGLHILYSRGIASKAQRISSCVLSRITESVSLTNLIWFCPLIFMCILE